MTDQEMKMKRYKITYHLRPEADNIVMLVFANTYEDACVYAKEYRPEAFSCEEI